MLTLSVFPRLLAQKLPRAIYINRLQISMIEVANQTVLRQM